MNRLGIYNGISSAKVLQKFSSVAMIVFFKYFSSETFFSSSVISSVIPSRFSPESQTFKVVSGISLRFTRDITSVCASRVFFARISLGTHRGFPPKISTGFFY